MIDHFGITVADFAAALAAGGTVNGAPGLRPHCHPGCDGAVLLDAEGRNVETVDHSWPG